MKRFFVPLRDGEHLLPDGTRVVVNADRDSDAYKDFCKRMAGKDLRSVVRSHRPRRRSNGEA